MKRLFKFIFVLVIALMLSGCGETRIIEIDKKTFETYVEDKKDFILYISQTGCGYCQKMRPELHEALSDYNLTAYEINIAKLSEDEYEKFVEQLEFTGTPTTIFFKGGVETSKMNRIGGSRSANEIKTYFDKNGFKKVK